MTLVAHRARARARARAGGASARDAKCGSKRPSDTFGRTATTQQPRGPPRDRLPLRRFLGSAEKCGRARTALASLVVTPVRESCTTPHGAARDAFEGSPPARRDAPMATTMVTIAARAPARATARSAGGRSTPSAPVVRYPANVPRRLRERARSVFPAIPSPRGVDRACSRVTTRAMDGDGDDSGASETPGLRTPRTKTRPRHPWSRRNSPSPASAPPSIAAWTSRGASTATARRSTTPWTPPRTPISSSSASSSSAASPSSPSSSDPGPRPITTGDTKLSRASERAAPGSVG